MRRIQKVGESDAMEHLGAKSIGNGKADVGAVLGRIAMNAAKPLYGPASYSAARA